MTTNTLSNSDQTAILENSNPLLANHYKELIEKRSLPLDWVLANCRSISIHKATELLGYPAKSPGILLQGDGWQVQFKPDRPWLSGHDTSAGKKRAPKYRTPQEYAGDYDAILPSHPSDKAFWQDMEALKERAYKVQGHPCLLVTEGLFKAISGTSNGLPTIALLGVEMGLTSSKNDPQGKRYLVPSLEKFAKAGFGFITAFDADCVANKNVVEAERKLIHQLRKFDVPLYSITGKWAVDDGKGMDDYIKQKGIETFRQVLADITEQYKAPSEDEVKKAKKPPTPEQFAARLAEEYQPQWAFHNEQKTWRVFNGKIWEERETDEFMSLLYATAKLNSIEVKTPAYLENVAKFLKWQLLVKKWFSFDRKEWIAFNNGVLEVSTGKIHEHSPGFRFVSCLHRDYRPLTFSKKSPDSMQLLANKCPVFYNWAMEAMNNDESKVLKLLAIVNGVIKFRFHDLQMFIHLIGKPGTGKGTFSRLLEKVVGKENHKSSRLEKLGDDYELAKIIDSQLVICPDEDKQVGKYGGLKALTGGDSVTYREIYKSPADSPFYGTILIISNSPIFAGDTSGLDRRLCLVSFQNKIPSYKRNAGMEEALENELTALTSVALSLPDNQVTQTLRGIGDAEIPEFKKEGWMLKCQLSSVASWINERIIYDPNSFEYLKNLHADHKQYCDNSGQSAVNDKRLCADTVQICNELGWEEVKRDRKADGTIIKGIRLRQKGHDDGIPWIEETFLTPSAADVVIEFSPASLCSCNEDVSEAIKAIQGKDDEANEAKMQNFLEITEVLPQEEHLEPSNSEYLPDEMYIVPESATDKALEHEDTSTSASTLPKPIASSAVPEVPAVGWWARVEGKLAQITAYYPHGVCFKGEGVYGVYRSYQLLTELEMLQLGLSWHNIL